MKNEIVIPIKRANGFKNLLGSRFGRLLVIEYMGSEVVSREPKIKYKSLWKVACDCGNVLTVRGNSLTSATRSCGCIRSEKTVAFNKKTKTKTAYDTFSVVWQSYRRGAKDRDIEFSLMLKMNSTILHN